MRPAMIGFGRMGADMARRLIEDGQAAGWNRTFAVVEKLAGEGVEPVKPPEEAVSALDRPRVFRVMTPMGKATDETIDELLSAMRLGFGGHAEVPR